MTAMAKIGYGLWWVADEGNGNENENLIHIPINGVASYPMVQPLTKYNLSANLFPEC